MLRRAPPHDATSLPPTPRLSAGPQLVNARAFGERAFGAWPPAEPRRKGNPSREGNFACNFGPSPLAPRRTAPVLSAVALWSDPMVFLRRSCSTRRPEVILRWACRSLALNQTSTTCRPPLPFEQREKERRSACNWFRLTAEVLLLNGLVPAAWAAAHQRSSCSRRALAPYLSHASALRLRTSRPLDGALHRNDGIEGLRPGLSQGGRLNVLRPACAQFDAARATRYPGPRLEAGPPARPAVCRRYWITTKSNSAFL